jgi:hypothetical protein
MSATAIQIIFRECIDGKAVVRVGVLKPSKKVYGEAEVLGNTSNIWAIEALLRNAERVAGRRARRVLAQTR